MKILMIGYAKRALEPGSRERARMRSYVAQVEELHVLVFTRRSEGFASVQQEGNLFLHATNTRTRPGALIQAVLMGRTIVQPGDEWVISSQDPFETSLVGLVLARLCRCMHQVQLHSDVFSSHAATNLMSKMRQRFARYVVRRARCIRVVSKRIKRSLLALGVPEERVSVLPIQADTSAFLEAGEQREDSVHQPLHFLYVGRFSSEKCVPLLLAAFAAARPQEAATLTLLGSGPDEAALKAQVAALGLHERVSFKEWTNDVPAVMAAHDVLCLASAHEGWGMVLQEAAGAGLAIITTDVGAAGEVVLHEETGLVVPVNNTAAYTTALEHYIEEPALVRTHGQAGHQRAKEFAYTEEEYLQNWKNSYLRCIKK